MLVLTIDALDCDEILLSYPHDHERTLYRAAGDERVV